MEWKHLLHFHRKEFAYFVLHGGRIDSTVAFEGYWRYAQNVNTGLTQLKIDTEEGGGYGYKLSSTNMLPGHYTRGGGAATVRIEWVSHNLFGAGFATGWLPISSLSESNASTSLGTTNVVALQRYNVQLHGSIGPYRVHATATVFESTIESSEWDFGYMLALSTAYPLSPAIRIGVEVKWNNISKVQVSLLSLHARVLIILWEW